MAKTFSIYDNALTDDLLDRCDGPVHLDVLACRVSSAIKHGNYSPEEIAAAAMEAIHVLNANGGYIQSNEFER
jgi:hypothetical protein